jgi:hypothetical protein
MKKHSIETNLPIENETHGKIDTWMVNNKFKYKMYDVIHKDLKVFGRLVISHRSKVFIDTGEITLKKKKQYTFQKMYLICREYLRDKKINMLLNDQ